MNSTLVSFVIFIVFGSFTATLAISAVISFYERELGAGYKLFLASVIAFILTYALGNSEFAAKPYVAAALIMAVAITTILFLKKPIKQSKVIQGVPRRVIDEIDTIFARMKLKPDEPLWEEYYSKHTTEKLLDDKARELPGLLSSKSNFYNPLTFGTADTNFTLIHYLQKAINHPTTLAGEQTIDEGILTNYIKSWATYLGVHSIGITELKDYHLYTKKGRGDQIGEEIIKKHKFAIAFTVEMDFRNVKSAPSSPIIFESSQQYLKSANIALQIATFLKSLGFDSRAHIDGDYELICPLVARDAGLGEVGRMGLLMTPTLGPRVRVAVVTSNAPLAADSYTPDPTVVEFCRICKKCAVCCPGKSIPSDDMQVIDEVMRWKINSELCYLYWCSAGTDCGRCISVCPYSHPNNILHNAIRHLIRRSAMFARVALVLDNWLYSRKPKPLKSPDWMGTKSTKRGN